MTEEIITQEEIISELATRETFYYELHRIQKEVDGYYELIFDAGIPTSLGYEQITPPSAREWVDVGVRHYTLDNPKAAMWPRGSSKAEREKDATCEAFLNFLLIHNILEIKEGAKTLLLRGETFHRIVMDDTFYGEKAKLLAQGLSKEELKEFDKKRLLHFPLRMYTPDPLNVFPSAAHNGLMPADVIESYNMTVGEMRNLCKRNGWKWTTSMKSTAPVKFISYISDTHRCFLVGGIDGKGYEPLLEPAVEKNILGICPYIHVPSGFGKRSYEGKPEYYYRSILYALKAVLRLESRVISQFDALSAQYAWIWPKIIGEEAAVQELYPTGEVDMNRKKPLRENERVKIEFVAGPEPPSSLFQEYAMMTSRAQPPAVLGGTRPAGVYYGSGMETLAGLAKPLYKDAIANYQDGLAVLMGIALRLMDTIYQHEVGIRDLSYSSKTGQRVLRPKRDIGGHYDCKVNLLAEPPEATDMRKSLGSNLRKAGDVSHLHTLTQYHDMSEEEAMAEIAQINAEEAMTQPGVLEVLGQDAAKRLGVDQAEENAEATGNKISKSPPPTKTPRDVEGASELVRKRGRTSPGMEGVPSPGE